MSVDITLKVKLTMSSSHTEPFNLGSEMHPRTVCSPQYLSLSLPCKVKLTAGCAFCSSQLPPSTKPFQEAQSELNQAAADLNQSAGEVVHATRGQSGELAAASGKFSDDFDEFLDAGIEMAGQAQVGVEVAVWIDRHLSTLMDCPPLRPIRQIGAGNL